MTDNVRKPTEGYFKIESFVDGELVDTYETPNMIMKLSKASVAEAIKGTKHNGICTGSPTAEGTYENYISTFVLGNGGHVNGDLLTPRTFSFARTNLFAEENAAAGESQNIDTYPITFDPGLTNINGDGNAPVTDEGAVFAPADSSLVYITTEDASTIKYVIEIPAENGNGTGQSPIAWSEAALYTQEGKNLTTTPKSLGKIFAMRTFPAKIKDTATSFKITWRVVF